MLAVACLQCLPDGPLSAGPCCPSHCWPAPTSHPARNTQVIFIPPSTHLIPPTHPIHPFPHPLMQTFAHPSIPALLRPSDCPIILPSIHPPVYLSSHQFFVPAFFCLHSCLLFVHSFTHLFEQPYIWLHVRSDSSCNIQPKPSLLNISDCVNALHSQTSTMAKHIASCVVDCTTCC